MIHNKSVRGNNTIQEAKGISNAVVFIAVTKFFN